MSSRRVVAAGLAAWLAVMVVGSVLVWAVVGRVGQQLEASEAPLVATQSTAVAVVTPAGGNGNRRPDRNPDRTPSASATPSGTPSSAPPSSVATSAPPTTPASTRPPAATHSSHPSGGHSTGTSGPTSGPTGSPSPTPVAQRRTWYGVPGLVTAECRAAVVSLVAAQPGSGFSVEVKKRDPDRLEVEFEGTGDEDERKWKVTARCVGGSPSFAIEVDD